jgi:hypothetical protein
MVKKSIAILCIVLFTVNFVFQCKRTMSEPPPQDPGYRLGEVTKLWYPRRVEVKDGFVYRYRLHDKFDTAVYYMTGPDTFEVTTTFKKWIPNKPALPDIITKIDDNVTISSGQSYFPTQNAGDNIFITGGWNHFKGQTWNAPHHNNTFSFVDNVAGAYVELEFTGYRVEWFSEKRINHGIVTVQIDGGSPQDVDLYDATDTNNSKKVFTSVDLPNAVHKIRVMYTGRKNTNATQTNIGHDYFVVYKKQ